MPEPRTIFSSAAKLPPGHSLTVTARRAGAGAARVLGCRVHASSTLSAEQACGRTGRAAARKRAAAHDLRSAARRVSVRRRRFERGRRDDGGRVGRRRSTPARFVFRSRYDESEYAQQVAQRYRTRHHVERVESDDFDLIDKLARLYDEPYADSSAIPTYRVCQLARKHVTVALSGDGGDENFAGYRRYRLHMMEERMRRRCRSRCAGPCSGCSAACIRRPTGRRACCAPRPRSRRWRAIRWRRISIACRSCATTCAVGSTRTRSRRELAGYNAIEVFQRHAAKANQEDPLSLIQYLDLKTYLVGDIHTKVDRASMAHSLEVREPLMDHPLVEWLATLPSSFKLRGGEGKWLLKKALEPHLPRDVLYRTKMGFAVPLAAWFRGPLRARVRAAATGERLLCTGMFKRGRADALVDQHQSGVRDHSAPLWALLMFEAFLRGSESAHAPALKVA